MRREIAKLLLGFVGLIVLASCSVIQLKPEAQQIRILSEQPKGCTYVGKAVGSQGNLLTGQITGNQTLEQGALNDMKNKAADMGANVLLMTNRGGSAGDPSRYGSSFSLRLLQTNVTYIGLAYKCPERDDKNNK